tara:strand:- start:7100 stop:9235 length:2136 start_codon:yes stop_codon:yes gene_type:complete
MVKYLVCILVSSNIRLLKESFNSVNNQKNFNDYDIFIIVNTLNDIFHQEVLTEFGHSHYPKLKKIIRTESNGYPGKGHNSVLKVFYKDNRYENLIMLDGDDFLFPFALERINNVKNMEKSDVIPLVGNTSINRFSTSFNKIHDSEYTDNNTHQYDLNISYKVSECKNIHHIHPDYNKLLITPFRLLCTNRKILDKYEKLYDERMYVYDDFMYTILFYKEIKKGDIKFTLLSDAYTYLYNGINDNSVSLKYRNNIKSKNDELDNENKLKLFKEFNMDVNKYDLTELSVKPYHKIIKDTINIEDVYNFHNEMIIKLQTVIPTLLPKKRIIFIDYSDWNYNTINTRSLGGTESAIYSLSKKLANEYDIIVMTKSKETIQIHSDFIYVPLSEDIIYKLKPDIIVFQGQCPLNKDFFMNINPNMKLWNWLHHDISVQFITNKVIHFPFDKYIFVSNWQKNRYIQHFKLQHSKCVVLQNGISDFINIDDLKILPKEKTLIYYSTPYRGLIIAYHLFQQIKKIIPDIKFKIFSCFNRNSKNDKTRYLPIKSLDEINETPEDRTYGSVYKLLIDDPNIDFYGSVPQKVLFEHVKKAMIFFYPNTYPETCCTSILEAMAHRCNVISSELGAIPETSNGFANLFNPLIDVLHDRYNTNQCIDNPIQIDDVSTNYCKSFIEKTIDIINNYYSNYNQELLTNQQSYIEKCKWSDRAETFKKFL